MLDFLLLWFVDLPQRSVADQDVVFFRKPDHDKEPSGVTTLRGHDDLSEF